MAIEKVREYFAGCGMADRILEFDSSSATVELAAQALSCEPRRIAKSLSFMLGEEPILVVTAGATRRSTTQNTRLNSARRQKC